MQMDYSPRYGVLPNDIVQEPAKRLSALDLELEAAYSLDDRLKELQRC